MGDSQQNPKVGVSSRQRLKDTIAQLCDEIRALYLSDYSPWVVGYSGGKDSTATLQLIWTAIRGLGSAERTKPIHVISTDTLVENPVVAMWVAKSLETMARAAQDEHIPIETHRLMPEVNDSFWVNLIGRGYPAPRHKFRWCTERLKIKPSNTFIQSLVNNYGDTILVLGTRKAESQVRASRMQRLEEGRVRERLSPNESLPGCSVYTPIEDWSNDEVWAFLTQWDNPWGYDNHQLLTMYQGASPDGECPLVVDLSTPSCGDSRFGCWVCTVVGEDKSMKAMVKNDQEKDWMMPLLRIRNALDPGKDKGKKDREKRDFRRISGLVQVDLGNDPDNLRRREPRLVPGPYLQPVREDLLRKLLTAQKLIRRNPEAPEGVKEIELISLEQLQEIRRIWVEDKHEIEDRLPAIYREVTGKEFPDSDAYAGRLFREEELKILEQLCRKPDGGFDRLHYELIRELLDVQESYRTAARRSGLFKAIEDAFEKCFYDDEVDALNRAVLRHRARHPDMQFPDTQPSLFNGLDARAKNEEEAPAFRK